MKKKFESNVATEIPKTKLHEPALPWKLTAEDVGEIGAKDDEFASVISGTPPLKTRASFLILLVITIFGITAYLVSNAVVENEKMRKNVATKEGEISLIQMNLVRAAAEKEAINKNAAQLEKKISDLTAQKELFTSVIESLTKKGDDLDATQAQAVPILTGSTN
ncbi:MAG: hypothetical protein PHI58_03930 [Candidatus Omnitrophica bacterium]|nr:hypothetical protein [Candidatus Omnitrophota bacterium]